MTINIPMPSSLLSNLVALLGLAGIVVAIGALSSWPWALLAAGIICVLGCVLVQNLEPNEARESNAARTQRLLHTPPPPAAPPAPAGMRPESTFTH